MYLVLVKENINDKRFLDEMEKNINTCNKLISEYLDPITQCKNCIKVHQNYEDYNNLMEINLFLQAPKVQEIFENIKKDLNKKLGDIPLGELKDLSNNDLKADNLKELRENIKNFYERPQKVKFEYHLVNFL